MGLGKHRIIISSARPLGPTGAWGQAMAVLREAGHLIVATSGNELPEPWPHRAGVRVTPNNIRGLVTQTPTVSNDAIDKYTAYRFSPGYAETHSMLMLMMSRVDSTGTFRLLEREVLARKMHLEIFSALEEAKPTLGIFDVTPHEALDFALMRVLEWQGIPLVMFQPSLVGPQVMARTSLTEILPVELAPDVILRHRKALDEVHRIADASLQRLAQGTGTPKMDNQKAKEAQVGSFPTRVRAVRYSLKRLSTPGRDVAFALTGHSDIPNRLRRLLELLLERSLRRSLRKRIEQLPSLTEAPSHRFALFALHYEPERSSIPEGYPFDSQLDAISAVRTLLPADVTLYVKEHFSQKAAALRGFVGRSPDFYDLLGSIPGVTVLGTATNTRALMKAAECVMTFTGKVGIEAALEEARVVFLGQPWWENMPGARNFHHLGTYEELLAAPIPKTAEVQQWLTHQVRHSLLPGVSSVPPERHSKRIAVLPEGFEDVEAEGIVAAVHAIILRGDRPSQRA